MSGWSHVYRPACLSVSLSPSLSRHLSFTHYIPAFIPFLSASLSGLAPYLSIYPPPHTHTLSLSLYLPISLSLPLPLSSPSSLLISVTFNKKRHFTISFNHTQNLDVRQHCDVKCPSTSVITFRLIWCRTKATFVSPVSVDDMAC